MTQEPMTPPGQQGVPRSLFILSLLYGGMTCTAGILGAKQLALGPLAVEAGILPFLLLVAIASTVAELHGRKTADSLVRWGFLPMLTAMALIWLVIQLPHDPGMYPPAIPAFPIVLGQGARMMLAGLIAYGASQTLNLLIFTRLSRNAGRALALRGAVASAASQVVDTVIFITLSFLGERPILHLILGQMTAKILLSIILMPILIHLLVAIGRRLDGDPM